MVHWVNATLLVSLASAGCSLIYNPSNLPPTPPIDGTPEAPPDILIIPDADPSMLTLERVTPSTLFEGQGVGGSRRATITIHGTNMVNDNTTVTITAHAGESIVPLLTVDNAAIVVSDTTTSLAVPVTLPVDTTLGNQLVRLDVTVSQMAGGELKTVTLSELADTSPVVNLQGLPELLSNNNIAVTPTPQPLLFSQVDVTGNITITANENPLRIFAMSSIVIGGTVLANAAGQNGFAGGGVGGAGGAGGVAGSPGGAGTGPAPGQTSGGPAGFIGDEQLTTLNGDNRGSGGAGGNGSTLQAGGVGGGGGGTIDLAAGGNISVGTVEAKGGNGGSGANTGGAGSGGTILVRSIGGTVTVTGSISVAGGTSAGTGAAGRARIDAAGTITPATGFRGPTLEASTPLIVTNKRPTLTVLAEPSRAFIYSFNNDDGSQSKGPFNEQVPPNGTKDFTLTQDLFPGTNELCFTVEGAVGNSDTRNCILLVYLFDGL